MLARTFITEPIITANPVVRYMLGICSALAVTTSVATALTMGIALTVVLICSSAVISLIRNHIPNSVRLIIQIIIIASFVIVIDLLVQAFAFDLSKRLSIFVALIVTNCLVLGRAEAFARKNPFWPSVLDGLGNGLGYSLVLVAVGSIRELLGAGSLLGFQVLPLRGDGGWFEPLQVIMLAPSAFFIMGLLVWALRAWQPSQVEEAEFRLQEPQEKII